MPNPPGAGSRLFFAHCAPNGAILRVAVDLTDPSAVIIETSFSQMALHQIFNARFLKRWLSEVVGEHIKAAANARQIMHIKRETYRLRDTDSRPA